MLISRTPDSKKYWCFFLCIWVVDSVVISFQDNKERIPLKDEKFFEIIVKDSFQFRRKTIRNNLKQYNLKIVEEVLNEYGYDLNVRAEMLPIDFFVKLSNALKK